MNEQLRSFLILFVILCIASFFRLLDINWDNNYHLHPDERFLAMVVNDMRLPEDFFTYFDPNTSPMNPRNFGYEFFVYGTFPLILAKFLAVLEGVDSYGPFVVFGRTISALTDLLIVLFVYKIVELISTHSSISKNAKYYAAGLYSLMVLPIQLSHFFTTDMFMAFGVVASIYFILRFYYYKGAVSLILSGFFLSFALASKVSAVYCAPLIGFFIALAVFHSYKNKKNSKQEHNRNIALSELNLFVKPKVLIPTLSYGVIFGITCYVTLRLLNPYYFETASFFDIRLSNEFLQNIEQLESFNGNDVWFPPAIQWMSTTPIWSPFKNMVLMGLGFPISFIFFLGMYRFIKKHRTFELNVILIWMLVFFLFQSVQFTKNMRYFIYMYPFIAIFGAIGLNYILETLRERLKPKSYLIGAYVTVALFVFIWPLMFINIYIQEHSRIQATEWIYQNIPDRSYILTEHWDDPLPLLSPDSFGKTFVGEQVEIFGVDNPAKFTRIENQLLVADYYIMSSNRGWGSIPKVPWKYPEMAKFYDQLLAGEKGFEIIKEFSVYPSLEYLGIPLSIPNQWADESFTVYDHPKVIIMKKKSFSQDPS